MRAPTNESVVDFVESVSTMGPIQHDLVKWDDWQDNDNMASQHLTVLNILFIHSFLFPQFIKFSNIRAELVLKIIVWNSNCEHLKHNVSINLTLLHRSTPIVQYKKHASLFDNTDGNSVTGDCTLFAVYLTLLYRVNKSVNTEGECGIVGKHCFIFLFLINWSIMTTNGLYVSVDKHLMGKKKTYKWHTRFCATKWGFSKFGENWLRTHG